MAACGGGVRGLLHFIELHTEAIVAQKKPKESPRIGRDHSGIRNGEMVPAQAIDRKGVEVGEGAGNVVSRPPEADERFLDDILGVGRAGHPLPREEN